MNSMIGKSTGIALLMAAALLAALFAMGVFSATGVGAAVVPDDADTTANEGPRVTLSDYTPGATNVTLTATFQISPAISDTDATLTVGDPTATPGADAFRFPDFAPDGTTVPLMVSAVPDLSISQGGTNRVGTAAQITAIADSSVGGINIAVTDDTATTGDVVVATGQNIVITIKGVTNPNAAGIYQIPVNDGNTAVDATVRLAGLSSQEPGVPVQIVLNGDATAADDSAAPVAVGNDIEVDLTGFAVPATIGESSVIFTDPDGATTGSSFVGSPETVVVSGKKVLLTVPRLNAAGEANTETVTGNYAITFKQSAGITNPDTAGNKKITITENAPSARKDTLWTTIDRVINLDKTSGTRGTMVAVTGKGYGSGTSTVYLQQVHTTASATALNMENTTANAATLAPEPLLKTDYKAGDAKGDPVQLGSATTADGSFTLTIDTTAPDFVVGTWTPAGSTAVNGVNRIQATDASGADTDSMAYFRVKGKVAVSPASIAKAGTLTVTLTDWTAGVTRVSIGGVEDCDGDTAGVQRCFLDANGAISQTPNLVSTGNKHVFKVKVPTTVPLGTQQVAIRGSSGTVAGTSDVIISAQELTVTPTTAARGQSVSISGAGFAPMGNATNGEIVSITVGGVSVPASDNINNIDVVSGGNVNFTITIPKNKTLLRDGENTIVVTAHNGGVGTAKVNIPKAAISLEPATSRRGTEVSVTGSGFFAGELVLVEYAGSETRRVASELADGSGGFTATFNVPNVAEIGKAQKVTATADVTVSNVTHTISAQATHTTPDATITITPGTAAPGSRVTISGIDFPLYTAVKDMTIDGLPVLPVPTPITDEQGAFSATVVVPQAERGDRTVLVDVGGTIKTAFLTIGDAAVSNAPADVFAPLGDRLERVWYLVGATQEWLFYDPDPDLADFNNLTSVTAGEAYIIIITAGEPVDFQGRTLYAGSNNVPLR